MMMETNVIFRRFFFYPHFVSSCFSSYYFPYHDFSFLKLSTANAEKPDPNMIKCTPPTQRKNSFARMNFIHKYSSKAINNSETHFELRNPCSLTNTNTDTRNKYEVFRIKFFGKKGFKEFRVLFFGNLVIIKSVGNFKTDCYEPFAFIYC